MDPVDKHSEKKRKIVVRVSPKKKMVFVGDCSSCGSWTEGFVDLYDFNSYCTDCYRLHYSRVFSIAGVYDAKSGSLIKMGHSWSDAHVCAERQAIWKVCNDDGIDLSTPKTLVVCRVRRSKKKSSLGMSKPCAQCIVAMGLCNIERVCYSTFSGWKWENASDIRNDEYETQSLCIFSSQS